MSILEEQEQRPSPMLKWGTLVAVSLGLFLGAIDSSIVNVALPTLIRDLNTDFPTIQWVVLSYLLGLTVLMVTMGRIADLVGKKQMFTTGVIVFVLGSALCGFSPDVYWLIAFRFVQSIGAAMLLALGVAIVTEVWPNSERGKALGFTAGVISSGIVVGPALGGVILEWLNWRWIFYVNLPIGALATALVMIFVPPLVPSSTRERFDFAGALILGGGLLALALALTLGQNRGFATPLILILLALAVLAIPLFVWVERRVQYPIVDLTLFAEPQFSLNLFTGWLTFVAIAGIVLLLPFYLELVLALPLQSVGLIMAVVPIVLTVMQPFSGTLSDRLGTRPVSIVGLVITLGGYLVMTTLAVDSSPLGFIVRMLPVATGMAIFQSPNNSAIMGSVPRARLGVASGILSMTRTLGQLTGIAVLGAFFNARLQSHGGSGTALQTASPETIMQAIHDQFWLVTILIVFGLLVALWTWKREREIGEAMQAVQPVTE